MQPKSDFAALVDDLDTQAGGAAGKLAPVLASFDYFTLAHELKRSATPVPDGFAAAEYESIAAFDPGEFIDPPKEEETVVQPSTDPADVARELALDDLDAAAMARVRRDFASANHPDRVAAAIRVAALARMQIANALIDEAEKRLPRLEAIR